MSDNANKIGTSMQSIQNAYQGFAKANYTMLDNLKLGYGGTKEEMERLVADAAKLSDTVDAQSLAFDNVVKAIHVVQTELGITGTTAEEAGATISGSINSMKAAWENLIIGLGNDNADIEKLFKDLVVSITGDGTETNRGVLGNLLPRAKKIFEGMREAIGEAVPYISEGAKDIVDGLIAKFENPEGLFDFLDGAIAIVDGFITKIDDDNVITRIKDGAISFLKSFGDWFKNSENLASLKDSVISIVDEMGARFKDEGLILKIFNAAAGIVSDLSTGISSNAGNIGLGVGSLVDEIKDLLLGEDGSWESVGKDIGSRVLRGIWDSIKSIGHTVLGTTQLLGAYLDSKTGQNSQIVKEEVNQGLEWWEKGGGLTDFIEGVYDGLKGDESPTEIPENYNPTTSALFGTGTTTTTTPYAKDYIDEKKKEVEDAVATLPAGESILASAIASSFVGTGVTGGETIYVGVEVDGEQIAEALIPSIKRKANQKGVSVALA
jgi:phage-related protein